MFITTKRRLKCLGTQQLKFHVGNNIECQAQCVLLALIYVIKTTF